MSNQVNKILIELIYDPAVSMRSRTDDTALEDLALSIKTNGLIQPVILKQKGDRYEVVAGHRRLQAHRQIKLTHIDAIIREYTDSEAESAKVHENLFREEVNAVDQAAFMARYLDRTKCTLEELARMLNRTQEWVTGRLEILKYPNYLIDEVYNGKISLGVAKWLNEIPSEATKKEYTRFAGLQGINIKTAKRWSELAYTGTLPENPAQLPQGTDVYNMPAESIKVRCVICGNVDEMIRVETDFLHPACRAEMAQELHRAFQQTNLEKQEIQQ